MEEAPQIEQSPPPRYEQPEQRVEERVEQRVEERAEERVEQRAERPAVPAPALAPRVNPKELLRDAGLVMIETDQSKAKIQPQAEEPQQLGRPRRERPKPAPQDGGELVQVETTTKK